MEGFKKGRCDEGEKEHRKTNKRVQKILKKVKEDWRDTQCKEIDARLNKNNGKKTYQLVKDLSLDKHCRATTIQDMSRMCLTEEQEILVRWTRHCSELW